MLQLKNITKNYIAGNTDVEALKGIDLEFRKSEFVSILGPSGCGKTTLLNLLGGLDRYTTGDIVINGKSTMDFTDRDWDTYRNRSIGFVFQNYNLIPHQTVLSNVELALTLSGVSKTERHRRAIKVLEDVGLGDQIHKKPNQMSGGQMQRVAIARALINNPEILLADEPTGALDSETSVQIMEILKEISKDRLIVMVTHNGDLAEKYSTRIIRLLDGQVTGDSDPYHSGKERMKVDKKQQRKGRKKKTSMSFFTALSLSLNNLLTKKTRTFMTAFAGSIGIIGIALILSLSNGFQTYINKIQEDTLSSYPISIEETSTDLGALMTSIQAFGSESESHELDKVYSNDIMGTLFESLLSEVETNDLGRFKQYIEENQEDLEPYINAVSYSYHLDLNLYYDGADGYTQVNPLSFFSRMASSMGSGMMMGASMDIWTEMIGNQTLLESQYDVLAGRWPSSYNEVVIIVDENNELTDYSLYGLGLKDQQELSEMYKAMSAGGEFHSEPASFTYDELLELSYKLVPNPGYYQQYDGGWQDMREDQDYMASVLEDALNIQVVGVIRPNEDSVMTAVGGAVGYTSALTEYVVGAVNDADIVQEQLASPDIDVFTGKEFAGEEALEDVQEPDMSELSEEMQAYMATLSEEELAALMESYSTVSSATYEENVQKLGIVNLDIPSSINIYPVDFASKETLVDFITDYNQLMVDEGTEEYTISYTDYMGMIMSSVSTIINAISYILIAFVGISLVVSSIMIGIITYVSVLERTKEIGILKSIGASRKDISRVFNAETLIVGFVAGMLGILVTLLLSIPANMIIYNITSIPNVAALPIVGAVVLVLLSMGLTLVAGLIPSRLAAKKDPVKALRTE